MSERKIIKQVSVDAKIYDRSLGEKTVNMIHEDIPRLREEPCLSVDVVFNRGVYGMRPFSNIRCPKRSRDNSREMRESGLSKRFMTY